MPRIAGSHRTHWYNWKNGEWTNWKMVNAWWFLTIFLLPLGYNIMQAGGGSSSGAKFGMWKKMPRIAGSHRINWYNWKNGEWANWKMVKAWWFLTIFLRGHLVYRKTSGWQQQPGEIWSVGGDMMNSGFIPETTIKLKQYYWEYFFGSVAISCQTMYQMTWREWPI